MTALVSTGQQRRRQLRQTLEPGDLVAIIDTREQLPLELSPMKTVTGTLQTGDYSIVGLEHLVAVERKSLEDLISCVGVSRERFDREVQRLLGYPTRAVVVEATWANLEAGNWRSKVTPQAAVGSVLGWIERGVPILMAGNHASSGRIVSRLLWIAARRRWRELAAFGGSIREAAIGARLQQPNEYQSGEDEISKG